MELDRFARTFNVEFVKFVHPFQTDVCPTEALCEAASRAVALVVGARCHKVFRHLLAPTGPFDAPVEDAKKSAEDMQRCLEEMNAILNEIPALHSPFRTLIRVLRTADTSNKP